MDVRNPVKEFSITTCGSMKGLHTQLNKNDISIDKANSR
jgi:hypothetical protein